MIVAGAVTYSLSLVALNQLWYADFEREPFHFFNDNSEWKQMDKLGHFYSAFHISKISQRGLQWSGLENNKSAFWGTMVSVLVMTPIEIFDGFSAEYGASTGDLIANSIGGLLFFSQYRLWQEVRVHPKYSFNRTDFPDLRPEVLGSNLSEELLKDYNAHHYWLSIDLSKFNDKVPKWLNIAIGYGATNLVFANDDQNSAQGFDSRRRYFLALDFDLNNYKSKSKVINTLIYLVNMTKIPSPTLEFSKNKFKFHPFYY
ncbi:MAG TPA: DUF2279 domain-containing protein [Fulvivirga sp.]|nr:DUF2279 domain-containing protein [Fulvivirga sp.]